MGSAWAVWQIVRRFAAFAMRHWDLLLPLLAIVTIVTMGMRIRSLDAELAQVKGDLATASATVAKSEQLRAKEQAQTRQSFDTAAQRCDQRVTTARDATAAIQEIVSHGEGNKGAGTTADASRPIVGADQLRRVIGQASGGAARVPAGSNGTTPH